MNQLILWVVKHLPKPLQNIYFKYEKGLLYCFYGALTTLVSMITKLVPMYFLGEGKLSVTFCTVFSWICAVTFAFFTNKKYVKPIPKKLSGRNLFHFIPQEGLLFS